MDGFDGSIDRLATETAFSGVVRVDRDGDASVSFRSIHVQALALACASHSGETFHVEVGEDA